MRNGVVLRIGLKREFCLVGLSHTLVTLDCEQSLFLENRGEERKTSKRASVTVSVTCLRGCRVLLIARASEDSQSRTCFEFFTTD